MKCNLDPFKEAQSFCIHDVFTQIQNGRKTSHWMWYIFPQIAGLGKSSTSKIYEIVDLNEARQYLEDELLSSRLIELVQILVDEISNKTAHEIFGYPDHLKFHSSLTLFYLVVKIYPTIFSKIEFAYFEKALMKYFSGEIDEATRLLLFKS